MYCNQVAPNVISATIQQRCSLAARGVNPPKAMMHLPPCFRFPLFQNIFLFLSTKISENLFLVIDSKFVTFPLILQNSYIPPYFEKKQFSPIFYISSYFRSIYVFCLIYAFLLLPYFVHDAFMHHAVHVLDAPVSCSCMHVCACVC